MFGNSKHYIESNFYFGENVDVNIVDGYILAKSLIDNNSIKIVFETDFEIKIEILDSYISKSYGTKTNSKCVKIYANSICPLSLKTKIFC